MNTQQRYFNELPLFNKMVHRLFQRIEPAANFKLFIEEAGEQLGIDILSERNKSAIQCFVKDTTKSDAALVGELIKDIKERTTKIFRNDLGIASLLVVTNHKDDELLEEFVKSLPQQFPQLQKIKYIGQNTLQLLLNEYNLDFGSETKTDTQLPKYLTEIPSIKKDELFGVNAIHSKIFEILNQPVKQDFVNRKGKQNSVKDKLFKPLVLHNANSGTGKTSVVASFALSEEYAAAYNHIAYISLNATPLTSFHLQIKKVFFDNFSQLTENNVTFEELWDTLENISGDNLLIIDNIESNKQIMELLQSIGTTSAWNILLVTFRKIDAYNNLLLPHLLEGYATDLFQKYCDKAKGSKTLTQKLVEHLEYNLLLIEFTAKKANKFKSENIEQIMKLYAEVDRRTPHLKHLINPELRFTQMQTERKILKYLLALYEEEAHNLTKSQKDYLRYFAVLPSKSLTFNKLCLLFGISQDDQHAFSDDLLELASKNWLKVFGNSFMMHQAVQLVMRKKLKPDGDNCKQIIKEIVSYLHNNALRNFEEGREFVTYGLQIVDTMEHDNELIANLSNNLAIMVEAFGDLTLSVNLLLRTAEIEENILDEYDPALAITYDNISIAFNKLHNYKLELEYAEKAMDIKETALQENDLELADSYRELAVIYNKVEDYEKAIEYIDKALDIYKEELAPNDEKIQQALKIQEHISMYHSQYEKWKFKKDFNL